MPSTFLVRALDLDAIVSSQEFRWLETKWKTKTEFWRGKEPSERLERVQGQKDLGSKGIISYKGIQLHFDNTLYPNESKDDLWFYVGFTVAGPYAYDPVDNDTYATLRRIRSSSTASSSLSEKSIISDKSGTSSSTSSNHDTRGKPRVSKMHVSWQPNDAEENKHDGSEFFEKRNSHKQSHMRDVNDGDPEGRTGWVTVRGRSGSPSAYASANHPQKQMKSQWGTKAAENRAEVEGVTSKGDKWTAVKGTCGSKTRCFDAKRVGTDGKLHHGAFVRGAKKSKECIFHDATSKTEFVDRCDFAHGWKGDTLQFVCTKCTDENKACCNEKKQHERFIWNLGPYYNSRGEVWKDEKGSR